MSRARTLSKLFNTDGNLNLSPVETINGNAPFGRKNLIINGGMTVAQRATAATTVSGTAVYDTVDRMKLWESTGGSMNSEQSTTAPAGFSKSLKLTVASADTSLAAGEYACFAQLIEAQNLQHLQYGTNGAKTVTVSFYVRSNKTGTYCFMLLKEDATTYHYVKEFTINTADTWERKEITIAPDSNIKASGGAIADDNGIGFQCFIGLAWGSTYNGATDGVWSSDTNDYATSNQVNWMDSTSNDFYFTGFQVEVGEVATDFEHRSYGEELALCQRYFFATELTTAWFIDAYLLASSYCIQAIPFATTMRAFPTTTADTSTNWVKANILSLAVSTYNVNHSSLQIRASSNGRTYAYYNASDGATIKFDAEL